MRTKLVAAAVIGAVMLAAGVACFLARPDRESVAVEATGAPTAPSRASASPPDARQARSPTSADAARPASARSPVADAGESACGRPPRILIINLSRSPEAPVGIPEIAEAVHEARPAIDVVTKHYAAVTQKTLARIRPDAVILSPQADPWWQYPTQDVEPLAALVRSFEMPVLGICGGHQFLAIAFGGRVAPIEGEPGPEGYAGHPRERGPTRVEVVKSDPIFGEAVVGTSVQVAENHVEEVKEVPAEFEVLARGTFSPYQAIRHRSRPIWGVQFHPEETVAGAVTGHVVLRQFLAMLARCGGGD